MFQFTTTTLINSASDVQVMESPKGTKVGFRAKYGPTFLKKDKDCITVYKTLFQEENPPKAVLDLSACTNADKTYRIALYVRSTGNADPIYANDFVFKGKPFYVEFAGATSNVAQKVVNLANKYMLALYDSKQLEFTVEDSKLAIKGINGFQVFHKIAIQEYIPATNGNTYVEGYWKNLAEINREDADKLTDSTNKIVVTEGNERIGTYSQILADLRLPTGDNMAYMNANASQMPIVNGKYTQFTIYLCKELKGYPGGIGVNNPVESITTHVFFVEANALSAFETALADGIDKSNFSTIDKESFKTKDVNPKDGAVSDVEVGVV